MKVSLQQDVKGHGKKGQMVEVSDGYARNFLLPRKLAVEATAENVNTPTQPTTEKYHTYIVREHNGMVADFQQGEDKPFKITDTYVSSLANADRQSLSNGIQVDTKEELRKLLEDLCS